MSDKPVDRTSRDIETLRQEFEKFRAGLGDAADKLSDNAQAALSQITSYFDGNDLSSRMHSVGDQLTSFGARLKESGKDAVDELEYQVSNKPMAAIAIAFGVGLVAAAFMRRR